MQMRFIKSITGKQSVEWLSETKNTICEIFLPARLKLKTLICFHSLLIFTFDRGTCYFSLWWKINNDKKTHDIDLAILLFTTSKTAICWAFIQFACRQLGKIQPFFSNSEQLKLVWASFGELEVLRFHFPLVTRLYLDALSACDPIKQKWSVFNRHRLT